MQTMEAVKTFESYYKQEAYDKALVFLKNNNVFSKEIELYNLGLLNFKLENYSASRLYLEKAKDAGFESAETNELIEKSEFNLGVKARPETIKDHIIYNTGAMNVDILLISSMVALFIVLFKIKQLQGMFLRISMLFIFILPLTWSLVYKFSFKQYIALTDREIHAGPSKMFNDTFPMPEGLKFVVSKNYKNWGYITYPDKYSGWILIDKKEEI